MSPDKARQIGNDLACLAASLAEIAEEIKSMYDFDHDEPEPAPPEPKAMTLEEVRAVLIEKTQAGFREQVQAAIRKHADKLSAIDPAEYPSLIADVEGLR